jgi:hypothetical protein
VAGRRSRTVLEPGLRSSGAEQLSWLDILRQQEATEQRLRDEGAVRALHSRDATASTLVARIEQAARRSPRVRLDLTGEITSYATSFHAQDLLLAERAIEQQINPTRLSRSEPPIELGYILPDERVARLSVGLADLARLGLQRHLRDLTSSQVDLLDELSLGSVSGPIGKPEVTPPDEEPTECGEITLLSLERITTTCTIQPLLARVRKNLQPLLQQGLPGIDAAYVRKVMTFIEETVSNVRDHAADAESIHTCEGFVAANRTKTYYLDRRRGERVTVYTTYLSCYDLGQGILASLAEVPKLATELTAVSAPLRNIRALDLAIRPGVTSRPDEDGRGEGLPQLVELVHSLAIVGDSQTHIYRGGLHVTSGGAELRLLTTTHGSAQDRLLPGTQLQLTFEAVHRMPA